MIGALSSFLSSCTWAIGSSSFGLLSKTHSPFAVNFTRALVALPLFVVSALFSLGGPAALVESIGEVESWRYLWLLTSMVASYGVGDAFFLWSTRSLGVPAALAICSGYPVWTTLVGVIYLGQSVDGFRLLGVLVTLAGVIVVILSGARESGAGYRWSLQGLLCALVASGLWALNNVAISIGASGELSPFLANSIRMVFALMIAGSLGRVLDRRSKLIIPWTQLRPLLWVFVLEGFGGSLLFLYGLTHSPLAVAAVLSSLAPVLAVPIAWWVTGERPTPQKTFGICVTVAGIGLLAF